VFAHSKGIIHRDLKPGNIWLDEDGAAKIGDFGLAIATDRSRLTQEKMMVGTVSYMPPEQATGGEITPKADLYSLGAMLYEMVTGRPPFVGDDDIAIIGQHINTPPVAPIWHNKSLPQTLDSLIMRLLSKNPAERPESAGDVLSALEAIDVSNIAETAAQEDDSEQGSLDSMAGGVFVGRHKEMDQLKAKLENALSGRGGMVAIVGEPGIGKTRTSLELETYAGLRNAQVLWGKCYEGGGAPPYWPWVQAIRSYVATHEPDDLRREMGSTASVISEIVPDVKERLPDVQEPVKLDDPESARFRLFDSIATFLKNAGQVKPIMLVLDDLHWADKPSLLLLEFVARELASSRVMIVGTYRDMELNRRHPLSVTLGDLTRERLFERVLLRGLTRQDVSRFVEIAAGTAPPRGLIDAIHTQTEGNPLFITETVRLLIQEGEFKPDKTNRSDSSWNIRIPEGVREVIGRRLDRLSERCNEVLTIASVIGREFTLDQLRATVEDTTEGQLLDVLDEGLAARVIEELHEQVGLYQFTHALIEETLSDELTLTRRVRVHARIAQAMEEMYGDSSDEHAEVLAKHFEQAQTVLGPDRMAHYCRVAGESALAAFGFDEAARYFESALEAFGNDGDPDKIALLHRNAAIAHSALRNADAALDHIGAAFKHFVDTGQNELAATVARISFVSGLGQVRMSPYIKQSLELLDETSEQRPWVMSNLGRTMSMFEDTYDEALPILEEALEIARTREDRVLEMQVLADLSISAQWNLDNELGFRASHEMVALGEHVNDPLSMSQAHRSIATEEALAGDLSAAMRSSDVAIEAARRSGDHQRLGTNFAQKSSLQVRFGEWDDAIASASAALEVAAYDIRANALLMLVGAQTGQYSEMEKQRQFLLEPKEHEWSDMQSIALWAAAHSGRKEDLDLWTSLELDQQGELHRNKSTTSGKYFVRCLTAALTADAERSAELLPGLLKLPPYFGYFGFWPDTLALAGLLSKVCGKLDDAVGYLGESLSNSQETQTPPAIAMSSEVLAEVLLERDDPGDHDKAVELQDEAIAIATEFGMKPLLERVLSQREILKA
ncbi:MAG: AAA family ATPase, partial [Chloroflexi bacterium]|nr:AAA family ATPase [Chloroflexota bacterium]